MRHEVVVAHQRLAKEGDEIIGADRATGEGRRVGGLQRLCLGHGHLAADLADQLFEVAHAGLARIAAHQARQRGVAEGEILGAQSVRDALLGHQVIARDRQLFGLDVAGQADDLHAIAQRLGDAAEVVGGADEQHAREVDAHVEVMVEEVLVLFRVQHLKQRRGRIALVADRQLVDFIEQDHRIHRAAAAQRLHQLAGQGADVGAAVALDLGLVAHAAKREAEELPPQVARDRLPDRGLAGAGRADQGDDAAAAILLQSAHGAKLDDALLDLVEAVVVLVEAGAQPAEIKVVGGVLAPRQVGQPFQP